jgi:hypothetical protein
MAIKRGLRLFLAASRREVWFDCLNRINLEKARGSHRQGVESFFCIYTSRKYNNLGWI